MSGDDIVGLIIAVLLLAYPGLRPRGPGEAVVTAAGWAELALLDRPHRHHDAAARRLHGEGVRPVARQAPRRPVLLGRSSGPIYRLCGINPEGEQRWTVYAMSLLAFSFVSVLILYAQLRLQGHLLLNPDHYKGVEPKLAFNTAVSFLTNTNWQNYGEAIMSHLPR